MGAEHVRGELLELDVNASKRDTRVRGWLDPPGLGGGWKEWPGQPSPPTTPAYSTALRTRPADLTFLRDARLPDRDRQRH